MDFMGAAIFQQDGGEFWNGGRSPCSVIAVANVSKYCNVEWSVLRVVSIK